MLFLLFLLLIILLVLVAIRARANCNDLLRRSRGTIVSKTPTGLNNVRKREKAIFAGVQLLSTNGPQARTDYERPLDIVEEDVLPPPEPIQGINRGNDIL